MPSRFVFFDLGNVLVKFDHRVAAMQLSVAAGCPVELVLETVFRSDLQQRYETGLVSDDQYAREINDMLGADMSPACVMEAISNIFEPNWPILDVLKGLRDSEIPMGILSNTCDAHWKWLMQRDWPMLHGWFEHCVLSYEIGSMKPHDAIYEACERLSGRRATQIFFTDDRPENVSGAARRGWSTCLFHEVSHLQASIARWLAGDDRLED